MHIRTLLHYLIGDRDAILKLAADRRALGAGALFVLSAGFAREYDGADLLHEPWHLLIPLGASLASSFLLFLVACGKVFFQPNRPPFWAAYRSFLTLFWLTAPLAWLYAIPYERFASPPDAVRLNLLTLGLVALWRVLLMIRVVSVLTGIRVIHAAFLVMAFADTVTLTATFVIPVPIVSLMGGIRLTPSELVIHSTMVLIRVFGFLSAPVWGIGALAAWVNVRPGWQVSPSSTASESGRWTWGLGIASVAVWAMILPWTQPEQQLRLAVERDVNAGRIVEALDRMSAHRPCDFPPHWEPPPHVAYGRMRPHINDVMDVVIDHPPAPWVREMFLDKFKRYVGDPSEESLYWEKHGADLAGIARILGRLPEGPELAREHRIYISSYIREDAIAETQDQESLKAILKRAQE